MIIIVFLKKYYLNNILLCSFKKIHTRSSKVRELWQFLGEQNDFNSKIHAVLGFECFSNARQTKI